MNTATIQVQYVNPPRQANWRHGSVKDTNGQRWSIAKEHLGMFSPNQTVEILWEQIGQYPTIIGMGGQPFPSAPRPPQPGTAAPQTAAQIYNKPVLAPQQPGPVAQLPAPDKEEGMFIMGVVGRAMGSGNFSIEEIPELTRTARYAWQTRQKLAEVQVRETQESPAHQARSDIDSQYGVEHPNMTDIPMTDPNDPGPLGAA